MREGDSPRGRGRPARLIAALLASAALGAALAGPAAAEFPFTRPAGDPTDPTDLYLDPGQVTDDLGSNEFKFAATPDPANGPQINANPIELFGVRGAHVVDDDPAVSTAFTQTTGRPDVTIAILDSGIKWNDAGAMLDLRFKTRLNRGELPPPQGDLASADANEPGEDCSAYSDADGDGYDVNDDAVFNLRDYACDSRVDPDPALGVGPDFPSGPNQGQPMLDPQDVLIAFSSATFVSGGVAGRIDDDGNGYVDDMVGWDFVDDDNDPYDDVQYGHGTGEARGSTSEADNGGELSSCPNCMGVHLRVGDSFIADVDRFGAAVTYATDNGVQVVQEALGTLNNSSLAREAVNYAYRHGVTVMASAADEAAQHNNWPSNLPHTIVVNSVRDTPVPPPNNSYLSVNGCTNFNAKITLSIPSTSCSSDAVGLASGYAGLIYSAAYNARDKGQLDPYPDTAACETVAGDPCVITPNEVRQLLASGRVDGTLQSDDVDFAGPPPTAGEPEPSCSPVPLPGCTSPYGVGGALRAQVNVNRPGFAPGPAESYPARFGHDQFYGYGRANLDKGTSSLYNPADPAPARVPPEAEIFSPEWFQPINPAAAAINVEGEVYARGAPYRCQVLVAPGQYPNQQQAPAGDFKPVGSGYCNGTTVHAGAAAEKLHRGSLASISVAALKSQFPPGTDFTGPVPPATTATGNGRPFFAPHAFTFKVVVATTQGTPMRGEDQRSAYLHRDADLLPGFPRAIKRGGEVGGGAPTGDGESSPAFADLDGDNRNEMIFGTSDGFVHALRPNGSELPGWPVRGDRPGFVTGHRASPAYASGDVSQNLGGAIISSVAVGDPDRDGVPTVYAADFEGKLYGWSPDGRRVFTEESEIRFSGKPLSPFANVRQGETNRTQHGFFASPVLADLDGDGTDELIAAAMDRHVYAWEVADPRPAAPGGAAEVPGFPLLVVDPAKVASVAPVTDAITFRADANSQQQGAIIDTPALADLAGDERPEIIVGTNEEYVEPLNAGNFTTASFAGLGRIGEIDDELEVVKPGNSRLYALRPEGGRDANPLPGDALVPGWPFKVGIAITGLLPVVGEGITGYPVVAELNCPSGGGGPKVGVLANNGPAYVLNADATSCYGSDGGKPNALESDASGGTGQVDRPVLPAVGHPAFGAQAGPQPSFLAPAAGLTRALDLALPDYQPSGQDFLGSWDTTTGQFRPGYPTAVNDLQFLTGPSIADLDGVPGEEVIEGTASQDLAAFNAAGTPISPRWPKLTTDWTVTNPLVGSFGTLDTNAGARKVAVAMTRSGLIHAYRTAAPACSPSSWPRFHHDNANSGDLSRDAGLPGKPAQIATNRTRDRVRFRAPGDDLLCGRAARYQVATSDSPIDDESFRRATRLNGAPAPAEPGTTQSYEVPSAAKRYIAIRAVDEQGNVGRTASIEVRAPRPPVPVELCVDVVRGTPGNDRLRGTKASERIRGAGGNDRIHGRGGADCIAAGRGADRASGGRAADRIKGGSGRDVLRGSGGADRIKGDGGADRIKGGRGGDLLRGGSGKDRLSGGAGDDGFDVRGGGRDRVTCGAGEDRVKADRRDRVSRRCERVKRG